MVDHQVMRMLAVMRAKFSARLADGEAVALWCLASEDRGLRFGDILRKTGFVTSTAASTLNRLRHRGDIDHIRERWIITDQGRQLVERIEAGICSTHAEP